jgi:tetratricopeptide (TPR) repeat protein
VSVPDDGQWLIAAQRVEFALSQLKQNVTSRNGLLVLDALASETMVEGDEANEALSEEQVLALYKDSVEALRQEQAEQALDGFSVLVSERPLNSQYLFGFALSLQHMGQLEKAAEFFSLTYGLDPSNSACAFRLGECLWALGHEPEAKDALRAAIELDAVAGADPKIRVIAQQLLDQLLSLS